MYRRRFGIRFLAFGLLFICAMALFRAGVAQGYMMAASGMEGAVVGPHYPMGHFRPVGFGFAPVMFGIGLIMFGLMILGKRSHHHHAWRHHGPGPGPRRGEHPHHYPGWWGWDWYYEEDEPSSPADRDKGASSEQKV